jgi:mono/diheme cytochrome c family protein
MSFRDSRPAVIRTVIAALAVLVASSVALAQGKQAKSDFGKREWDSNCAGCHGATGKGDGVYKPYLNKSPTDLTVLTKTNQGVFPFDYLCQVIDGRKAFEAHGARDMPIWGADYLAKAAGDYMDVPYDPELYVRTRILALVEYIHRLQAK